MRRVTNNPRGRPLPGGGPFRVHAEESLVESDRLEGHRWAAGRYTRTDWRMHIVGCTWSEYRWLIGWHKPWRCVCET